jgi:predicted HTH domain antitoxin
LGDASAESVRVADTPLERVRREHLTQAQEQTLVDAVLAGPSAAPAPASTARNPASGPSESSGAGPDPQALVSSGTWHSGASMAMWTWEMLASYMAQAFGIALSAQGLRRTLVRLGLWPGRGIASRRTLRRRAPGWWDHDLETARKQAESCGATLLVTRLLPLPRQRRLLVAHAPGPIGTTWFTILDPARASEEELSQIITTLEEPASGTAEADDPYGPVPVGPDTQVPADDPDERSPADDRGGRTPGDDRGGPAPDGPGNRVPADGSGGCPLTHDLSGCGPRDTADGRRRTRGGRPVEPRGGRPAQVREGRGGGWYSPIETLLVAAFGTPLVLVTEPGSAAGSRVFRAVGGQISLFPMPDDPRSQLRASASTLRQARVWLSQRQDEHKAATAAGAADREHEQAVRRSLCERVVMARLAGAEVGHIASASGLTRNDVHNICKRTSTADAGIAQSALLAELEDLAAGWRRAGERTREGRMARDRAADGYRAARRWAQTAREARDEMIVLCHASERLSLEEIARLAGVSITLVHLVVTAEGAEPGNVPTNKRLARDNGTPPAGTPARGRTAGPGRRAGAPRGGAAEGDVLAVLDRAVMTWRREQSRLEVLRAERDRWATVCREIRRRESEVRRERDEAIRDCRLAGVAGVRIAHEVGLELAGTLSRLRSGALRADAVPDEAGHLARLREIGVRRRAARGELERGSTVLAHVEEGRRLSGAALARLRGERDEALRACRRAGVTLAALSARTGLDSRTIREATV